MARVFTGNGAEFGDVLFFDVTNGVTAETGESDNGSGAYCYKILGSNQAGTYARKNLASLTKIWTRTRYKYTTDIASGSFIFLKIYNGATALADIRQNVLSGFLEIYLNGVLQDTGSIAIAEDTWARVEVLFYLHDTSGQITVKIDDVEDAAFSGDTIVDPTKNNITIMEWSSGQGDTLVYVDDLCLNDPTGGSDDTWPGEGRMIALTPDGNGDQSDWTGQDADSVDNFENVDETPPDGDTTYNENGTATEYDLYAVEDWDLAASQIIGVHAEYRARDTAAGAAEIKSVVKTHATEYRSAALTLPNSYGRLVGDRHVINPFTSLEWTDGDLDAMQAGPETV